MSTPINALVKFNTEVEQALADKRPVVALESTIITHGMPWPDNLHTAKAVEQAVRSAGATPATIAVLDGCIKVGLNEEELTKLARTTDAMKLSRADLAIAIARRSPGSTTVAATMIVAQLAGIRVFATGGIGGVHRGAELNFDVSADLQELSRTAVTVICAGAKAILDLPKTLETLETLGVPVLAYQQDELPAFWSRNSGLRAPLRVDSVEEIVDFLIARDQLQLDGGVLLANPVPAEQEIPFDEMRLLIDQAIENSQAAGVSGKDVTPWLLSHLTDLSRGKCLDSNKALIINNATLAASLAASLADALVRD